MCQHRYHHDFTNTDICEWPAFFDDIHTRTTKKEIRFTDLPVDKDGCCIFHSRDLEWKRANNFTDRVTELVYLLGHDSNPEDAYEDIAFVDFIMVGDKTLGKHFEKHDFKLDSADGKVFWLKNAVCKKHLRLQHVKFIDPVVVERAYFKYDLILDHCIFEDSVSVDKVITGTDLYIENTEFQKNLVTDGRNRIYCNLTIIDSHFVGRTNISGFTIEQTAVIDCNVFEKTDYVTGFNCAFDGGLDFTRNEFWHLHFDVCSFFGDCVFEDLRQKGSFVMMQPHIMGQLSFIGTEQNQLFNTKTKIHLTEDCFSELGHVSFDYCNIKDLGTAFIDNIRELEDTGLVEIYQTCQVERLTVVYEYTPYTDLKANIIEDFVHLITRYFSRWHSVNLTVNIVRDKKKQRIKVVFKTTDDISDGDFNEILSRFSDTLNQSRGSADSEISDIMHGYSDIVARLSKYAEVIGPEDIAGILSMKGRITINARQLTLNTKGDMKIEGSQVGIISTGDNANFEGNSITQNAAAGDINYGALTDELNGLIRELQRGSERHDDDIELLRNAAEEARKGNKGKVVEYLKAIPGAVLEVAHGVGTGVLAAFIAKFIGI